MLIGLASVVAAWAPGVGLGLIAAFSPRVAGPMVLRVMDVLLALPGLLLAIAVVSVLGPGLTNTVLAAGQNRAPAMQMPTMSRAMPGSISVRRR